MGCNFSRIQFDPQSQQFRTSSQEDFDPEKHFIRSDLTIHRGILTILVRWAKNIQYCNKIMWYP